MADDTPTEYDRRGVTESRAREIASEVWISKCKTLGIGLVGGLGIIAVLLMWGLNTQSEMRDQSRDYIVEKLDEISVSMKVLVHLPQKIASIEKTQESMDKRLLHLELVVK